MQNTDMAKSHLIPNKMDIKLNVLGATMMNRVGGEVDGGDVVVVNKRDLVDITKQLLEQMMKPGAFGNGVSHYPILCLSTRAGERWLSLGRPRDQRGPKVDTIA